MRLSNFLAVIGSLIVPLIIPAEAVEDWYWTVPPPKGPSGVNIGNIDLTRGSVSTLIWYSNMSSYHVALYQQQTPEAGGGGNFAGVIYTANGNGLGTVQFNWVVDPLNTDVSASSVYYLYIGYPLANALQSHYFNMKAPNPVQSITSTTSTTISSSTSSTLAASTPVALSSSSISTALVLTSTTTSSSSPDLARSSNNAASSSPNNQISQGTAIGLGVGLGIGVLVASIVAGFLFLKLRKRRQHQLTSHYGYGQHSQDSSAWSAAPHYMSSDEKHITPVVTQYYGPPLEMSDRPTSPVEAPGHVPKPMSPVEAPCHLPPR